MGIEDPAIWLVLSGTVSTALMTAMGLGFKVWREKIRAGSRNKNLVEALKDVKPEDRPAIIKAVAELERPADESPPVGEIVPSVTRRPRKTVRDSARD
ncbi:hypothetical protein OWR29_20915 [Actinoplanes sp. Pm04-4]|uniref:Uncharacterized protein n=1 Tax=Paractinoplanes pyxinae TaxID=2997416 RepID=A0ABT4B1T0_9ACTN|nr:hypothetical protein [Actinoplanes pyxinae]MCY1140466.1 hypothetical protein [Actinoplanes pyxinae]